MNGKLKHPFLSEGGHIAIAPNRQSRVSGHHVLHRVKRNRYRQGGATLVAGCLATENDESGYLRAGSLCNTIDSETDIASTSDHVTNFTRSGKFKWRFFSFLMT